MTSGNDRASPPPESRSRIFGLALLACLSCSGLTAPACAEETGQNEDTWTINALMHNLAQVRNAKATFIERKYLSILKTPLEYSGTLVYRAPGHLEKITLHPKPESLVLDKDDLVIQNGDVQKKRTLSLHDYPVVWAFVESFRSTLAGDIETLNHFYHVSLGGHPKQWQLALHPLDDGMKKWISEIRIRGSLNQIDSIDIRESGGDYSVMTISKEGP